MKIFKEEKTMESMSHYVEQVLSKQFTSQLPPQIEEIYADTDYKTPLLFILSPGADPLMGMLRLAKDNGVT